MNPTRSAVLLGLGVAAASFIFACSSPGSDDGGRSDDALTGSLTAAKACAVRDGYTAAELAAFHNLTKTQLPDGVTAATATSIAELHVANIGNVFVVEDASTISFFDSNGSLLAKAQKLSEDNLVWLGPTGSGLACGGATSSDASAPPVDVNDASSASSCLSTAPIDATQFPYRNSLPARAGRCSERELALLSTYYKIEGALWDFTVTAWRVSVSPGCGSCAFGEADASEWAPILVKDDQVDSIDRGGCIAAVSNNDECGRAYQQYQDCTLQACVTNCTTQDDYTACLQDPRVLQTSCKGAVDALNAACGDGKIAGYETACKGTSYAFEGPIRVMCVTGASSVTDAGRP